MPSIWIILLDVSGSMTEPFSATPAHDPLAEHSAWNTKLEAAKDLLLKQIANLRVHDIAIFSFSDHAKKIFHGSRSQYSLISAEIAALQGGGETNLAEALVKVTADPDFEQYTALTILILSDGLANVGDPIAAANALIAKYRTARIDTILIDESEDGKRIAEKVSVNGEVRSAISAPQLQLAVGSARASSIRHEISTMVEHRFQLESELAVISQEAPPLFLTITSPLELTPFSLRHEISPFLAALDGLQWEFNQARGVPRQVSITSISQASPVTISLKGLREAVELVLDSVIPWRRENAKLIAEAERRKKELENLNMEENIARQHAEAETGLIERKMELVGRMLNDIDPDHRLSPDDRLQVFSHLIYNINEISRTSIEFKILERNPNLDRRSSSLGDGNLS